MSTNVQGFKPPNDKYKAYKLIWETCKTQMIDPPQEVEEFFEDNDPTGVGVEVDIPHHDWDDGDMRQGIEVNLTDIPKDVTVIRFYNSW